MDEYRPFPVEQPVDTPLDRDPEDGALPQDEDAARAGERPERPAPNLDHPGGHLHGTVARLNKPRRFGFLRADDGVEVFFHASAIDTGPSAFDGLRPGQEVEFDCHQDEQGRGLAASLVTIVGEPPPEPPRQQRSVRPERGARGRERAPSSGERWHVAVLRERYDMPVSTQLERLLNEHGVKPGQFTFSFVDRAEGEGVDCWVAYYSANE
ncbi:MAG TPA: cold shock domain-containing protein [Chloroflexota bacterium]|jgi:cold shock CspA family protein|nr:cold shock domain-containing protein [Chloroflexota bacterium]